MSAEDTLFVKVSNAIDGTYYYPINAKGTKINSLQGIINSGSGSVTITLEGTLVNDPLTVYWHDITSDTYGYNNFTSSFICIDSGQKLKHYMYLRWKVIANTGANDGGWILYLVQRDEK